MLVGVAFIVDELHKGQRLVYRYPDVWKYNSIDSVQFAKLFRPKPTMFNTCFELVIGDIHYISYPTPCVDMDDDHESTITLFNVVIATERNDGMKNINNHKNKIDTKSSSNTEEYDSGVDNDVLRRIVKTLSLNLLREERRHRYVSREVELILTLLGKLDQESEQAVNSGESSD